MGKMSAQIDIRIENFSKLSPEEIERRVGEGGLGFPEDVGKTVGEIIGAVSQRGDEALVEYTKRFDGVGITSDPVSYTHLTLPTSDLV